MKVSFVTTVLNEEKTIKSLLDSLFKQSLIPSEVVIVDGGSSDKTLDSIKYYVSRIKDRLFLKNTRIKILVKKGNRAIGRNEAIRNTTGDIIACSDAGCTLDRNWIQEIVEPFDEKNVNVVAGYYKGLANSIFQKCLIPYVLVMPDKLNAKNFLPASRSMAFRKSIWKKVGGFPEEFSHNEDYVFAQKLKSIKAKIVFAKDAIVYWMPRKNLKEAFIMFFRFALGDTEASIFRLKAVLILTRYSVGIISLVLFVLFRYYFMFYVLGSIFLLYCFWSVFKNFVYVKNWQAFLMLPLLQLVSDIAIITGTTLGLLKKYGIYKAGDKRNIVDSCS